MLRVIRPVWTKATWDEGCGEEENWERCLDPILRRAVVKQVQAREHSHPLGILPSHQLSASAMPLLILYSLWLTGFHFSCPATGEPTTSSPRVQANKSLYKTLQSGWPNVQVTNWFLDPSLGSTTFISRPTNLEESLTHISLLPSFSLHSQGDHKQAFKGILSSLGQTSNFIHKSEFVKTVVLPY